MAKFNLVQKKLQSNLFVWPLPYTTIYPKMYKNIKVARLDFQGGIPSKFEH